MKILLLTTHLNLGGIGVYVLSLAKVLVRKGHQLFVVSSGGDLVAPLSSCGVRHFNLNIKTKSALNPKLYPAASRLVRIIKENEIEIIHAHTRVTQVLAHLAAKVANIPYVSTCHGFFKPRLLRKVFPCWGDHCVAISEAVREHLVNDLSVKKEDISVVHNGVEAERFSPQKFSQKQKQQLKRDYGLKSEAPIIGTVARLSSVKGQRYLIFAMREVIKACPEVQLLLVGDGPEKQRLLTQVQELGLANNIFFSPSTLDTSVPLSIMDIFVFPSLMEGLGLAIIEAQAMGLPVVASDVGGIYTVVKEGVNGLLVRPGNSQRLAEAIVGLLKDRNKAIAFGGQGRRQMLGQFGLKQMVDGIERVYAQVLSVKAKR
ncbi:glycosyltransferase family 4 protein [Candidatus Omnitrophota bacterium]